MSTWDFAWNPLLSVGWYSLNRPIYIIYKIHYSSLSLSLSLTHTHTHLSNYVDYLMIHISTYNF